MWGFGHVRSERVVGVGSWGSGCEYGLLMEANYTWTVFTNMRLFYFVFTIPMAV